MSKLKYEETGEKVNKGTATKSVEYEIKGLSLKKVLWVKAKQHKYALSVTLNIVFAIYFFLPFLPGEIVNLISSL